MGAAFVKTGVPHTVDALAHSPDRRAETVTGGVGHAEDSSFGYPSGTFVRLLDSRDLVLQRLRSAFDEQVSRKPA